MSQSPHLTSSPIASNQTNRASATPGPTLPPLPPASGSGSKSIPVTRTVAIIKNHALQHRFDIEPRIQQANFEVPRTLLLIVKERQMEFDVDTDPEPCPVWVYVLERRRAVEVWNSLMGDRDPERARRDTPNSLRALYGISREQNAFMGSPDLEAAEMQIASLFASSPPFPTTELPDTGYGTMSSMTESVLAELSALRVSDEGYAASSVAGASTTNGSAGKMFKARPLPATTLKPDIVPRMSRAAALRAGLEVDKTPSKPRVPLTKERLAQTFANVPGHKRSGSIAVASTAAPAIAPRMTRAASLRLGQTPIAPAIRKRSNTEGGEEDRRKSTFEGVPGHKRRESIAVASTKAPSVAPRLNKSAAMRIQKDKEGAAPPSAFRTPSGSKAPPLSRTSSQESTKSNMTPRPASQTSTRLSTISRASSQTATRPSLAPRASSVASVRPRPSLAPKANGTNGIEPKRPESRSAPTPTPKLRPRPSSIGAPTIAPKMNKSAALRAAKMEAENAAAAAAEAKKKARMSKVPPSSFKSIAT
ncbi:hypothetical protein BDQ17DRAFT_1321140 [Cyathus striatus]|nr:hypothetical protein BDQ17DRAFT_1321140 [Cyathus striatus]